MKKLFLGILFSIFLVSSTNSAEIIKAVLKVIPYSGTVDTIDVTFGGVKTNVGGVITKTIKTSALSNWSVWVFDSTTANGTLLVQYEELSTRMSTGSDGADKQTLWNSTNFSVDWEDHMPLGSLDAGSGVRFYLTWTGGDSGDTLGFEVNYPDNE